LTLIADSEKIALLLY